MPDSALLSASIQYGLVARSFPFTGKVLKGYLNATGVPPGLSYDNPGTEPAPNLSVCILASDGTTAKVIWGRRDGSLSVLFHPFTMSGKGSVRTHTSLVDQEHEDAVLDGTWASNGDAFVTAGADGLVKIWTSKPFQIASLQHSLSSPQPHTSIDYNNSKDSENYSNSQSLSHCVITYDPPLMYSLFFF